MTRDEFLDIVKQENLIPEYSLKREPGFSYGPYEYGWVYDDGKWCPYETDERAVTGYFGEYDTESEALEKLLYILRLEKRVAEGKKKRV